RGTAARAGTGAVPEYVGQSADPMTTCEKCGNSYSDGFDDVHRCPEPKPKPEQKSRQLPSDLDREFRRIAAEVTEHTVLTHTQQLMKLGFSALASLDMLTKIIIAKKEYADERTPQSDQPGVLRQSVRRRALRHAPSASPEQGLSHAVGADHACGSDQAAGRRVAGRLRTSSRGR